MILICNSDRRIDTQRLAIGHVFVFGRTKAIRDAKHIVLTDQFGTTISIDTDHIVATKGFKSQTVSIRVSHYRNLDSEFLDDRCFQFKRKRFGTLALRHDVLEKQIENYSLTTTALKEALMSKFHVHNAKVPYTGFPYSGLLLKEVGLDTDYAQFHDIDEAIECANKLHSVAPSGWQVIRTFSERVEYSTEQQPTEVESNDK